MKAYDSLKVTPLLPEALQPLQTLAMNLRWSWRDEAHALFRGIDPALWSATGHNPVTMIKSLRAEKVRELEQDKDFLHRLQLELEDFESYCEQDRWFKKQTSGGEDAKTTVAYFSMEFGVHQSLPIYSGGLGVLAGDHMKSASDLGVPIIGVGLLYTYGYFTQTLSREGWQQEHYTEHYPEDLAVTPVLDEQGEHLHVSVLYPEQREVKVAVWKADIGRVPLLLLDTNIDANPDDFRVITDRLYGGDAEHRIKQELVLGVAGLRAVQRFCEITGRDEPDVIHMNEGHAGFAGIERMGQLIVAGETFETALAVVRASTLFTTHTPVPAGIDRFDMLLAQRYLQADEQGNSRLAPGVPVARALELGKEDDPTRFNMAHLGLRLAQYANGVAKLHGAVSRSMFKDLYPNFEESEVPITSITNGVHIRTWVRGPMKSITSAMSGNRDLTTANHWNAPDAIGSSELWRVRNELRKELVTRSRMLSLESWENRGAQEAELGWTKNILDENALTIGFARRVSTYKRLTLMLQNPERLRRILTNPERPVQFVIAGKAHPADMGGKQLLQELVRYADEAGVRDRIIFIPDYNISMAKFLVAGSDVWLNNPIRPQEASGTSGMKAVMNGCLTLSISDGWWDEFRDDEAGWTIPSAVHADASLRDKWESQALYDILENEVVPMFYDRDEQGVPQAWVEKIRYSMSVVAPQVAAERMVRDYVTELYLPAGRSSRYANNLEHAREFAQWQGKVKDAWGNVEITGIQNVTGEAQAGGHAQLEATVELGSLSPEDVKVEAVVGRTDEYGEFIKPRKVEMQPDVETGKFVMDIPVSVPGTLGYTVRVIPDHKLLRSPAELGLVRFPN
ncbi:alpha-glucan family phosphorylase [Gulosibacter molinativorax]|uniref:glycogen phosphorylase n=1 Tax=Gulosibacter molinativorax TaxID=256821 RepID=A0ABT7C4P8_9MICO|nr:alpha-glucan family phosphorylase [Gulosibacter molinativorax]MDJ1369777.1 alpha-glucan family phosphorylase [Gulosibacter molinativorax]QUY61742.1 Alpha-1,4 glucan phosphorylase [Gulosibacter molinativorax]